MTVATTVVGEAVRTLHRVIVEGVSPEVDAGRFAIKRIVGDELRVRADIYADGHDSLGARLLWRRDDERAWNEVPMRLDNNDRWEGKFKLEKLGRYLYSVVGWADAFGSWSKDLKKRGFRFVGTTICYAFMQAVGMVNDHMADCSFAD